MQEQNAGSLDFGGRGEELMVYPNPNNGTFIIHASKPCDLRLLNSLGQLVENVQLNSFNNYSFEVCGLSTGFYFLQGSSVGSYVNQKIVVTNR
jgi:hypothetical protein